MDICDMVRDLAVRSHGDLEEGENYMAAQLIQEDGTIVSVEAVMPLNQIWIQGMLAFFPGEPMLVVALAFALESNMYLKKTQGAFFTCSMGSGQIILQKMAMDLDGGAESILRQVDSFAGLLHQLRDRYKAHISTFGQSSNADGQSSNAEYMALAQSAIKA
jgi:hypothetical protein